MNDVNRLRILQDVIDRRLTTRLAATRLEISDRHTLPTVAGALSCTWAAFLLVNRRRGQPGLVYKSPASYAHCVYISHIRSVPVPEIQSRLIEACIAGSRIMPRVAHYYFTLMMQRAVLRSFSLSVRSPLSHILKVQLPGYPTH